MDDLAIRHETIYTFPYEVFDYGNFFYSSILNSEFIPSSNLKILRLDLTLRTKFLLNVSESREGCQLRKYVANNEFNYGGTIDDYVNCTMGVDRKSGSAFEKICASIICSVRIFSIANMKGRFVIPNTLWSFNVYQIQNDNVTTYDRNI